MDYQDRLDKMQETWSNNKDTAPQKVPNGVYDMQLTLAELVETSGGKLQCSREHIIIEGDFDGENLPDRMFMEGNNEENTAKSMFYFNKWITTCGFESPATAAEIPDTIANMAAAMPRVRGYVKTDEMGFIRITVQKLLDDVVEEAPARPPAATPAKTGAMETPRKLKLIEFALQAKIAVTETMSEEEISFAITQAGAWNKADLTTEEAALLEGIGATFTEEAAAKAPPAKAPPAKTPPAKDTLETELEEFAKTYNVSVEGLKDFDWNAAEDLSETDKDLLQRAGLLEGSTPPEEEKAPEDPDAEAIAALRKFAESYEIPKEVPEGCKLATAVKNLNAYTWEEKDLTKAQAKLLTDNGVEVKPKKKAAPKKK
jgi:hypothetical protein